MWEFDCLHFAKYISMSPHGIVFKQTWCKKIYHMNRATWLKPLQLVVTGVLYVCLQYLHNMPKKCQDDDHVLIISCDEDRSVCKAAVDAGIPIVATEFILSGILQQQVNVNVYPLASLIGLILINFVVIVYHFIYFTKMLNEYVLYLFAEALRKTNVGGTHVETSIIPQKKLK